MRTLGDNTTAEIPLLGPSSDDENGAEIETPRTKGRRSEFFIISTLALIIFFLETGDELIQPAQTRVLESIYCRQYYTAHDPSLTFPAGIPESECKNHVIQGQVAMLKGWMAMIGAFVVLLVSVPWGYVADAYGRKRIVLLITAALWFRAAWQQAVCWADGSVDLKWIWGAAVTDLFGGGGAVASALVFTILADVVPEARRYVFLICSGMGRD